MATATVKGILKNAESTLLHNQPVESLFVMLTDPDRKVVQGPEQYAERSRELVDQLMLREKTAAQMLTLLGDFGPALRGDEKRALTGALRQQLRSMPPKQLFAFYRCCAEPDAVQPDVLAELLRKRKALKKTELLKLLKLTLTGEAAASVPPDFRAVYTALMQRAQSEERQQETSRRSLFGLAVKPQHQSQFPDSWSVHSCWCDGCGRTSFSGLRFRCQSCRDFDLCEQCHQRVQEGASIRGHTALHTVVIAQQPVQVFSELPVSSGQERKWRLEVRFSQKMQAHLASLRPDCLRRNTTPGHTDAVLLTLRALPVGTAAKVYVSVYPFNADATHFLGGLTPAQPSLQLEWARLLFDFWKKDTAPGSVVFPTIRLGIRLCPLADVLEKLRVDGGVLAPVVLPPGEPAAVAAAAAVASSSSSSSSSSLAAVALSPAELSSQGVVVCMGETQRFTLTDTMTFGDLLAKACNRWNLDPAEHQLQDEEYTVCDLSERVSRRRGTGLFRVASKDRHESTSSDWPW